MKYQTAHVESGEMVIDSTKQINQNELTSDCWLIQFTGLSACESCEIKDTNKCGGGDTLAKLQD